MATTSMLLEHISGCRGEKSVLLYLFLLEKIERSLATPFHAKHPFWLMCDWK